jgi:hypothetical protein
MFHFSLYLFVLSGQTLVFSSDRVGTDKLLGHQEVLLGYWGGCGSVMAIVVIVVPSLWILASSRVVRLLVVGLRN